MREINLTYVAFLGAASRVDLEDVLDAWVTVEPAKDLLVLPPVITWEVFIEKASKWSISEEHMGRIIDQAKRS
jgi:hypothetical protein